MELMKDNVSTKSTTVTTFQLNLKVLFASGIINVQLVIILLYSIEVAIEN
jgi:hypothetical protein